MMTSTQGGVVHDTPRAGGARSFEGGFTLIELMVVVAVVAILAAIAYPSFQDAVRKSKRGQVKADMVEYAQMAERHFSVANSYTDFALPREFSPREGGTVRYELDVVPTADAFVITATAVDDQLKDHCGDLSLDHTGAKTNSKGELADCW